MKIAVSSYSFSQAMNDGRMSIMDVIPKARELGYEGVEIVRGGQSDEEMRSLARELKTQSDGEGIPIIAYMVGADFLKNGLDKQVDILKREAEVASLLNVKRMRHDSTAGMDANGKKYTVEEALPIVAEGYRRVTEFAAGLGIHTMIENHGYFFQHSERVKKLVETVNHPNFGWLVDMGNFMCADQDSVEAVTMAAPMAVHAHAKDFHFKKKGQYVPSQGWFGTAGGNSLRGAIIGHGVVDVPKCLGILRAAGYDKWLSVEFEGMEDCLQALSYDIKNLKEMLAQ
ncbi:MAG: sugar phosphate isomerase/epimerase [Clostridia bacterium]|nr:sugar phosphate isomerase/epimerase [Clostridia bacterium]MBQ9408675.1 sugar phosphate isomerase/epimerase [Clostridia bacterium]